MSAVGEARVSAPSAMDEDFSAVYASLIGQAVGTELGVSFRKLVGTLPIHDLTHSLHPYPARVLRHIPRFLLGCEQLAVPGDAILDPFCGSGTILLEGARRGLPSTGIDINPVACLLSRVKLAPIPYHELELATERALKRSSRYRSSSEPNVVNIDYWFTAAARKALSRLARAVAEEAEGSYFDFLQLCLAQTAERVSLRDRRIPVPVRRNDHHTVAANQTVARVRDEFMANALNNASKIARLPKDLIKTAVHQGSISAPSPALSDAVRPNTYDLVMTSPPYGAAQKYIRSSSLSLGWLGYAGEGELAPLNASVIGRERVAAPAELPSVLVGSELDEQLTVVRERSVVRYNVYCTYFREMAEAFKQSVRTLKSGGHFVLIAGENNVAGQRIQTHRWLTTILESQGLRTVVTMNDQVRGRVLLTRRAGPHSQPLEHESVTILQSCGGSECLRGSNPQH